MSAGVRASRGAGVAGGGFSLIELMVVVIIIGIVAALAIPRSAAGSTGTRTTTPANHDALPLGAHARGGARRRGAHRDDGQRRDRPGDVHPLRGGGAEPRRPGGTARTPVATCKSPTSWAPARRGEHRVVLVDGVNLNGTIEARPTSRRSSASTIPRPGGRSTNVTAGTSATRRSAARTSSARSRRVRRRAAHRQRPRDSRHAHRDRHHTAAPSAASSCRPTAWRASSRTREPTMTPALPLPLAPARGYTAVEVLMAMTVMAIGAAAVMTMQKASVKGTSTRARPTWPTPSRARGSSASGATPCSGRSPGPASPAQQLRQRAALLRRTRSRPLVPPQADNGPTPRDDEPRLRHPRARPAAAPARDRRLLRELSAAVARRAGAAPGGPHPGRRARPLAARDHRLAPGLLQRETAALADPNTDNGPLLPNATRTPPSFTRST